MTTFAPPPLHQDPWNPEVDGMPMPHMEVLSPADLARQIQNIAGQLPRSEARDSIADLPGLVGQTRMRYENVLAGRAVQCIREVTHDGITGEVLDADVNDAFRDAAAEATGVVSDYEQDLIDRLTEHYGTGPSHEVDRHTHARSLATRAVRGKVATAVARQAEAACKSTRVELAPPVVRRAGDRKSIRLNSSHLSVSRMPSSA